MSVIVSERVGLRTLAQPEGDSTMTKPIGTGLEMISGLVAQMESQSRSEEAEIRNNADLMACQVEQLIRDLGDRAHIDETSRARQFISEIRELIRTKSKDVVRLRELASNLQQVGYVLSSSA
jgi:hypothetical protein